jgi:hypothetical protein
MTYATRENIPCYNQKFHAIYTDPSVTFDISSNPWVMGDPGFVPDPGVDAPDFDGHRQTGPPPQIKSGASFLGIGL